MKGTHLSRAIVDEILYGSGQSIPVGDPSDRPNEANVVSEMFFVADGSLIVAEFEAIATQPTRLEGMAPGERKVFFVYTFKGRHNKHKGLAAMTVIMEPAAALALMRTTRDLYQRVPIEFRND